MVGDAVEVIMVPFNFWIAEFVSLHIIILVARSPTHTQA